MSESERLAVVLHSARNCSQMLSAIDRRLSRAVKAIEDGDIETGRKLLEPLKDAIPQCMRILEFEEHDEGRQ